MEKRFASFFETRWALLVVLLVFVCFKIPHLFYPYYCDEAWVYIRAVKTMVENGPSLMPGCIPDNCARGHPLLFHFLFSIWIKCFGSSNVAIHTLALLTSVLLLISMYEGCRKLFGSRTAFLAVLLLVMNVLFFVQSAFVLPEVMVALFTFLSLYFYVIDRLLLASIMLTLLFFTKESGLVFGAVIGVDAMVCLFRNKENIWRHVQRLVAVTVPALLIGAFFLIQKARLGWYLSPEHTSLIHLDWNSSYPLLRDGLYSVFRVDVGNYLYIIVLVLLSIIPALRLKNIRYLFLSVPMAMVYAMTSTNVAHNIKDLILPALVLLSFVFAIYYLLRLNGNLGAPANKFIILMGICFVAYVYYLSLTLVEYRYLLVNMVFIFVFMAVVANTYIAATGNVLIYVVVASILVTGAYGFYVDEGNTDNDLESFHAMKVQELEVAFLEKENAYDQEIIIGSYWAMWHFTDPKESYLSTQRVFTKMKHERVNAGTRYAIYDNICDTGGYCDVSGSHDFQLVYNTKDNRTWAEIYKRK